MRRGYGMGGRRMMARRMMMYRAMGGGGCHGHHQEPSVEDRLAFLEEYQRDLEQETANVAERIRKLKERESAPEESTV